MRKVIIFIFAIMFFCVPLWGLRAQNAERIVFSVTPPLIKNNVSPGQLWKSYVKVINNNSIDIEVYPQVKDFRGGSETGTVEFIEKSSEEGKYLLSDWIVIDTDPVVVEAHKSKEISFIVNVPENASPGGHYAAILIGNKPPQYSESGATIKVSSLLASLILLSVDGEVEERGIIREFSTDKNFYFEPQANFKVRFENMGNVHIQPQGEIHIYDWFDKDRGVLSMNQGTDFGNVLPGGIRKWDFNWQGDDDLLGMGRYRAELILGFGSNGRQTINQTHYFWVINIGLLTITVGPILLFLIILFLLVRIYVRSAIRKTQRELGVVDEKLEVQEDQEKTQDKGHIWSRFKIVIILLIILLLGILGWFFLSGNTADTVNEESVNQKSEIKNQDDDEEIHPSHEAMEDEVGNSKLSPSKGSLEEGGINDKSDIASTTQSEISNLKFEMDSVTSTEESEVSSNIQSEINKSIVVDVLNGGGEAGMAGKAAELIQDTYVIGSIGNADAYEYNVTYIRYKAGLKDDAIKIRKMISDIAEIEEYEDQEADVVVFIGKDFR